MADAYHILGIGRTASDREIRRAYRRAALRTHPDRNPRATANEEFLRVQRAYDVLRNPRSRAVLNQALRAHARPGPAPSSRASGATGRPRQEVFWSEWAAAYARAPGAVGSRPGPKADRRGPKRSASAPGSPSIDEVFGRVESLKRRNAKGRDSKVAKVGATGRRWPSELAFTGLAYEVTAQADPGDRLLWTLVGMAVDAARSGR